MAIGQTVGTYHVFGRISFRGDVGGDPVEAVTAATGVNTANSSAGFTANTWTHILGVFNSASNVTVYLNGGNSATATTSVTGMGTPTATNVGTDSGAAAAFLSGLVAHAAIWNVSLTPTEVAALASGVLPSSIRSQSLLGYWPLDGLMSFEPNKGRLIGSGMTVQNAAGYAIGVPRMLFPPVDRRRQNVKAGGSTGSGSASFTIAASAGSKADAAGSGAATVTFTAAGTGAADVAGSGAASITFAAAAGGTADVAGSGAASLVFAAAAGGAADASGSGEASVSFTAVGGGDYDYDPGGSTDLAGSGSATVNFTVSGHGSADATPSPPSASGGGGGRTFRPSYHRERPKNETEKKHIPTSITTHRRDVELAVALMLMDDSLWCNRA